MHRNEFLGSLTNSFALRWLLKTLVARNDSAPEETSPQVPRCTLSDFSMQVKKILCVDSNLSKVCNNDDFRSTSNAVSSVRGTNCLPRTFPDRPPFLCLFCTKQAMCPFCTKQAMCRLASLAIRLPDSSGEQMSGFHVINSTSLLQSLWSLPTAVQSASTDHAVQQATILQLLQLSTFLSGHPATSSTTKRPDRGKPTLVGRLHCSSWRAEHTHQPRTPSEELTSVTDDCGLT